MEMSCSRHDWKELGMPCPWPDCEHGKPQGMNFFKQLGVAGDPQDPQYVRTSVYERNKVVGGGYHWNLIYRERDDQNGGGVVVEHPCFVPVIQ